MAGIPMRAGVLAGLAASAVLVSRACAYHYACRHAALLLQGPTINLRLLLCAPLVQGRLAAAVPRGGCTHTADSAI